MPSIYFEPVFLNEISLGEQCEREIIGKFEEPCQSKIILQLESEKSCLKQGLFHRSPQVP